jgi:hypothetical protein
LLQKHYLSKDKSLGVCGASLKAAIISDIPSS